MKGVSGTLPIDGLLPEILKYLQNNRNLVLEAAPGAGKTTRVPPALLTLTAQEVWVLEPRRIAARMAARRVASEMGERVGETVGYQVRFEDVSGPKTRLRFLTEGVLTRRMLSDRLLSNVGIVVLDEFHERHMDGDLALALLLNLQRTVRPDLRLLLMSATLDTEPIRRHLQCDVVTSEGRIFPLQERYTAPSNDRLDNQVAAALSSLLADSKHGDTLVFLPGAAEIRYAMQAVEPVARRHNLLVLPLHGDLSPAEQDRAVEPAPQRKVILSTNVAESSITIDGLSAVIDSGLERMAFDSPWTGIPELRITKISQASARQRAGRAARTGPGCVVRLYSQEDFLRRPPQNPPEIARRELAQLLLDLHAMNCDVRELPWLDSPPEEHVRAAKELLQRLGAFGPAGKAMARLPLTPRLARLVVEAEARDAAWSGCRIAAALSSGERLQGASRHASPSDLFLLAERDWQYRTKQTFDQICRATRVKQPQHAPDEALLISILSAFPDRVARRKQKGEYMLAGGGSAKLSEESALSGTDLIVAVDDEYRKDKGMQLNRLASKVEPE